MSSDAELNSEELRELDALEKRMVSAEGANAGDDDADDDEQEKPAPRPKSARGSKDAKSVREKKSADARVYKTICSTYIADIGIDALDGPLTKVYNEMWNVHVPNPNVRTFPSESKETPMSIIKVGKKRPSAAVRAKYADFIYANLLYVETTRGTRPVRKYAYSTAPKGSTLKAIKDPRNVVLIESRRAAPFHSPTFDPTEHYHDSHSDSEAQELLTTDGQHMFKFPPYDAGYVAWHALQAYRNKQSKEADNAAEEEEEEEGEEEEKKKKKKKEPEGPASSRQRREAAARTVLMEMNQYHEEGTHLPVVRSNEPTAFSAFYSTLAGRMKPLQSPEKDGLNAFPYDFELERSEVVNIMGAMVDNSKKLPALLASETIVKLVLIHGNPVRALCEAMPRFMHERDAVVMESNVQRHINAYLNDDKAQLEAAKNQANFILTNHFMSMLEEVKSALLVSMGPLVAFATSLRRLGKMSKCIAPTSGPELTSALTGKRIKRGTRFWLLQGIMWPHFTGGKPGVEIIATVEEHIDTTTFALREMPGLELVDV